MSLHHGLTDLRNNHFTDSYILPWYPTSYQASLRFCLYGPNLLRNKFLYSGYGAHTDNYPARTAYFAARMSLLLDRPTTAAVSQEATIQCRKRVAEFEKLLRETVQVHTAADPSFQA